MTGLRHLDSLCHPETSRGTRFAVSRIFCPPDRQTTDPVTDAGVFDAAVRSGRPYRPPLQTRPRFPRRGGLYARPKPGSDSRRGKASPWCPRGPQGSAASGRCGDRSGQAVGLTEGSRTAGDRRLTIPQTRFASQLPLHKGACPLRHRGWQRSARVRPTRRCGPGGHTGRPYGAGNGSFSGEISVDGIGIVL